MNNYVAYYRLSREYQSFNQQKEAVKKYVDRNGGKIIEEYEELACGDVFSWPEFAKAVEKARDLACPLIVAQPDRVSRNEDDFNKICNQVLIVFANR